MTRAALRTLVLILTVGLLPALAAAQDRISFQTAPLTIESAGKNHRFTVEIADTPERRALGLMHRSSLAPDAGMLFDFKVDQPVGMWMRNTRIPLDMLFVARDGRIVNIAERTVPYSETTVASRGAVRAVLELNGGTVARLGIKPGDRLVHPMFRGG